MKIKLLIAIIILPIFGFAQEDDIFENFGENKDIYDLTLEELFNTNVSSVSKKSESLFEAPLSASVVSREEIFNAGCTSIPEALRLMPGLIVREQTNGVYEVFVRGGENAIVGSFLPYMANANTLVMIDGRPVYNYLQGGTFWETLPVDLNDVERIELVRGAMSALYGPNAVSGVINIITRRPKNYTLYQVSNLQYGSHNSLIANTSIGYKWSQKFDVVVSGNLQQRDRYQENYYLYADNEYSDVENMKAVFGGAISPDMISARYPDPRQSLDREAANLFINYKPASLISFSFAAGVQNSWQQQAFSENTSSPFSTSQSNTRYFDLRSQVHNLSGQVSWLNGKQSPALETFGLTYDMTTLEAFFEYDFVFGQHQSNVKKFGEFSAGFLPEGHSISLRPGINYRQAVYDDTHYWENGEGFINDKGELTTFAMSLKFDYDIAKKFRFTTALRNDKHNYPSDKNFLSYQLSAKYHITPKHIIRTTMSRAYRGVYIMDTYSNFIIQADFQKDHYFFTGSKDGYLNPAHPNLIPRTQAGLVMGGFDQATASFLAPQMWNNGSYAFEFEGNRNLDLLHTDMFEIGYRARLSKNLAIDIEGFHQQLSDFVYPVITGENLQIDTIGGFQPDPVNMPSLVLPIQNASLHVTNQNANIPQRLVQQGITFSLNYYSKNISFRPYITLQETQVKDYTGYPEDVEGYDSLYTLNHQGTPSWFGGLYFNYQVTPTLNINLSPYFFGSSRIMHDFGALRPPLSDGDLEEGSGIDQLQGNLILNASVNFRLNSKLRLFVSGKNMLNSRQREYFFTDGIRSSYFAGLNFEF